MKLAIFSPNENLYSETFILEHKRIYKDCLYYYDGLVPKALENEGSFLNSINPYFRFIKDIYLRIRFPELKTIQERFLAHSLLSHKVTHVLAEFGLCASEVVHVCKSVSVKLIPVFHGYDISVKKVVSTYEDSYKLLLSYSSSVIAVSRHMIPELVRLGCDESKIHFIPCSPDWNDDIRETKRGNSRVLFVGRFVDKKAPIDVIIAFKAVLDCIPTASLTMVGDGYLLDACKQISKYLGIADRVTFTGPLGNKEVIELMMKHDVFVLPSVTAMNGDMEGTPVVIQEASMMGLPVVSTFHAGIPDVVVNAETGYLVEGHDIKALSDSMVKLLDDDELAARMGEAGRIFIKDNYTLQIELEKYRTVIESC